MTDATLRLLDAARAPVAVAVPELAALAEEAAPVGSRLGVAQLPAGWYALEVAGPTGEYALELRDLPQGLTRLFLPLVRR